MCSGGMRCGVLNCPISPMKMIFELAVNGHADAIITLNTQDFLPVAGTFGVEVLRPGEFLRRLHA